MSETIPQGFEKMTFDELVKHIEAANKKLSDLCHGREHWHMSIPVQPDDPDIAIGSGLSAGYELSKRVVALEHENAHLKTVIDIFEREQENELHRLTEELILLDDSEDDQ